MIKIYAISTGRVQVRVAQTESRGTGTGRMAGMLFDDHWSEWLPVYVWVIEHEEGIIVVDTGETSRVHDVIPGGTPSTAARYTSRSILTKKSDRSFAPSE